jgi:hypothetical protein
LFLFFMPGWRLAPIAELEQMHSGRLAADVASSWREGEVRLYFSWLGTDANLDGGRQSQA